MIKLNNFMCPIFIIEKKNLPYITGKIAVSNNNLIYSKGNKRITNNHSDKFTHLLRYKNDSIMISYKTLNKDNPKLNCRFKNMKSFAPNRIVLDNKLELNTNSYLFKTANKHNTIVFYNKADQSKISKFRKSKINLIKCSINKDKKLDIKMIMKKLYSLGCRNILIEGGDHLTSHLLKKKLFNKFYLFKSKKNLSKFVEHKLFNSSKILSLRYKNKKKLKSNFGKDSITLYMKKNV